MNNKIMLVEDILKEEILTVRALSKNRLVNNVIIKRDGQEAIDYLADPGNELPVAVIMDIKLPKLSGLEVLQVIRSWDRTRFLPVVMLTSSDETSDIRRAYDLGANSFVRKPVDITEFNAVVLALGSYWMDINKQP